MANHAHSTRLHAVVSFPHGDAELIALGAAWEANRKETEAIEGPYLDVVDPFPAEVDAAVSRNVVRYHQLMELIGSLPATTPAGLRVKAKAALGKLALLADNTVAPEDDDYVIWSLCRDLLTA